MAAHHSITMRPATEDELLALRVRAHSSPFFDHPLLNKLAPGCMLAAFAALPLALIVSFGIKASGIDSFRSGLDVLTHLLGALFCVAIAMGLAKRVKPDPELAAHERREREAELAEAIVEVVEVTTDRAVLFHPYDRDGCNVGLAIDIGSGRTLVVFTDLRDESMFDGQEWNPEHDPPPYLSTAAVFPTKRFTLARSPRTGYIFNIDAEGDFVRPEARDLPGITIDRENDRESQLIDSPLDDLG